MFGFADHPSMPKLDRALESNTDTGSRQMIQRVSNPNYNRGNKIQRLELTVTQLFREVLAKVRDNSQTCPQLELIVKSQPALRLTGEPLRLQNSTCVIYLGQITTFGHKANVTVNKLSNYTCNRNSKLR